MSFFRAASTKSNDNFIEQHNNMNNDKIHSFGDDYPRQDSFIRSSPDRASVGAVRRRREHARKLAEIASVDESDIQQRISPTSNRPYGSHGAFWTHSSSNASVVSSSANSSVNSLNSSSLNLDLMDLWDSNNNYEDQSRKSSFSASPQFSFTGMIVKKKKKKKQSTAETEQERRRHMKLMAEEAAALSVAAGHCPPPTPQHKEWEEFPSTWDHIPQKLSYAQSDIGDNKKSNWSRRPPLASPQQVKTNTFSTMPSNSSMSASFVRGGSTIVGKQGPPPVVNSSTVSTSSSTSCSSKDTRKARISKLASSTPTQTLVFDAFGINDAATTSQEQHAPSPSSLNTTVSTYHNEADCENTAELWTLETAKTTTTSSTLTSDVEIGHRNPFKEMAGFQTKTQSWRKQSEEEGANFPSKARSEIGTTATKMEQSPSVAKSNWRNRNNNSLQQQPSNINLTPANTTRPWRLGAKVAEEQDANKGSVSHSRPSESSSTLPWRVRLQEIKQQQQQQQEMNPGTKSVATQPLSINGSQQNSLTSRKVQPVLEGNSSTTLSLNMSRSSSFGYLGSAQRSPPNSSSKMSQEENISDAEKESVSHTVICQPSFPQASQQNSVRSGKAQSVIDGGTTQSFPRVLSISRSSSFGHLNNGEHSQHSTISNNKTIDTKVVKKSWTERESPRQNFKPEQNRNDDKQINNGNFIRVQLKKTGSLEALLNQQDAEKMKVLEEPCKEKMLEEPGTIHINSTMLDKDRNNHEEITNSSVGTADRGQPTASLYNSDSSTSETRDVAALIRKRIAMNKNRTPIKPIMDASPSNLSQPEDISVARSRLKAASSSGAFGQKLSLQRCRPPKIDTSAMHNSIEESDKCFQRNINDEEGTICDSVLATINGGDNDNPLNSMTRQSHVSPRRSLTRSWEEENQASSPAENAASNHSRLNYGTVVVYADENDSTPTVNRENKHASESLSPRSALHTAFVKRLGGTRLEKSGEIEPDQLAKDQQSRQEKSKRSDAVACKEDDVTSSSASSSMKDVLNAALLKRFRPPSPSNTICKESTTDAVDKLAEKSKDSSLDSSPAQKTVSNFDDPLLGKYYKMIKIGLPLEAVHHAMTKEGLDPKMLVSISSVNEPVPPTSAPTASHAAAEGVPVKKDPKFDKYYKMLKLGIPMDAVKHSIIRDGLDPSEFDSDKTKSADPDHHGKKSSSIAGTAVAMKAAFHIQQKAKDTVRRMRLHWESMNNSAVPANSVWAMLNSDPDIEEIYIDETEFKSLFQADNNETKSSRNGNFGVALEQKVGAVKVIDPKRANNGGIILARMKMGFDQVATSIEKLEEDALEPQQLQSLAEYLPTVDEANALKQYAATNGKNGIADMCECEKFMISMLNVRQAKNKIRCLLFKQQFPACFEQLEKDASTVENACDELFNSVRLRKLLGIVLNIGNKLNTAGSGQRKANAFTLESLLKLNQAKAFDKKTTVLHYVVLVVRRNNEFLTRFADDLPTVLVAAKIHWQQCLADLDEVENQLENIRKLALMEYQLSHGSDNSNTPKPECISDTPMPLEQEFAVLSSSKIGVFTLDAIKKVSFLRDKVELTQSKFENLLEYFGEPGKKIQANELFEIFVTFCRNFQKANEEVVQNEKAKAREERKTNSGIKSSSVEVLQDNDASQEKAKEQRSNESNQLGRPTTKQNMVMRLSAMQPNMAPLLRELEIHQNQKAEHPFATSILKDRNGNDQPAHSKLASKVAVNTPQNDILRQQRSPKNLIVAQDEQINRSSLQEKVVIKATEVGRSPRNETAVISDRAFSFDGALASGGKDTEQLKTKVFSNAEEGGRQNRFQAVPTPKYNESNTNTSSSHSPRHLSFLKGDRESPITMASISKDKQVGAHSIPDKSAGLTGSYASFKTETHVSPRHMSPAKEVPVVTDSIRRHSKFSTSRQSPTNGLLNSNERVNGCVVSDDDKVAKQRNTLKLAKADESASQNHFEVIPTPKHVENNNSKSSSQWTSPRNTALRQEDDDNLDNNSLYSQEKQVGSSSDKLSVGGHSCYKSETTASHPTGRPKSPADEAVTDTVRRQSPKNASLVTEIQKCYQNSPRDSGAALTSTNEKTEQPDSTEGIPTSSIYKMKPSNPSTPSVISEPPSKRIENAMMQNAMLRARVMRRRGIKR